MISLKEILIAPFGRVRFRDFFLADVITSMSEPLKDVARSAFYLYHIQNLEKQESFTTDKFINIFIIVFYFLPYWWRLMQCLNKYHKSGLRPHLFNSGKYLSKLLPPAIFVIVPGSRYIDHELFWLFLLINTFATVYCLVWDYYMDWGMFRSWEKGTFGLRPKISFSAKFYYFAMVTNFLLRFFWLSSIVDYKWESPFGKFMKNVDMLVFLKTMAELLRRTQWAIIRIENEFHNNFENYRTIPIIPKLMDDVDATLANL